MAKMWDLAPGTQVSVRALPADNVDYYGMEAYKTNLTSKTTTQHFWNQNELAQGLHIDVEEGYAYSLILTTVPKDGSKSSSLKVAIVPTHPSLPTAAPDMGIYTFSSQDPIWTWMFA